MCNRALVCTICALRMQIWHFGCQPRGMILDKGKVNQGSFALDFPIGPIAWRNDWRQNRSTK
jgi:hypothetical protein